MSHIKFEFHSNRHTLTYFTVKNKSVIFLHSWPQKWYRGLRFGTHTYIVSVSTFTDFCHGWAIFDPLADQNTRRRELVELPASENFPDFFLLVLRYQFETWYTHLAGSATRWGRVSSQSGHSDLLYNQKSFLHLWSQQLYRAFRFGTHTYIASILKCTDFRHGWAIFGPLVATNTQKVFWAFFYTFWDMNLKSGTHIP